MANAGFIEGSRDDTHRCRGLEMVNAAPRISLVGPARLDWVSTSLEFSNSESAFNQTSFAVVPSNTCICHQYVLSACAQRTTVQARISGNMRYRKLVGQK